MTWSDVVIGGPSAEEARAIREAVANASTLEEVERLNQMLRAGIVPVKAPAKNGKTNGNLKCETFQIAHYYQLREFFISFIGQEMEEEEEDEPMS